MDIRDTVSRVLLGIAFGFVMGIVMYQAAGMEVGIQNKGSVRAQLATDCVTDAGSQNCISSSTPYCAPPSTQCGAMGCCTGDQVCDANTGSCGDPPLSSSTPYPNPSSSSPESSSSTPHPDSSSSAPSSDSSSSPGGCCNTQTNSCS